MLKKLRLIVCFLPSLVYSQHIAHLEPSNWWTGMNDPFVQILVHGDQIAEFTPSLDYPGVALKQVHTTENKNYLFLDLEITREAKPGILQFSFKRNSEGFQHPFEIKSRTAGSANRQGFTNSDAIYLITPDRFVNGNPDNDSVEGYMDKLNRAEEYGRHGGDIQGIINSLDYIASMGFTQIWPMPLEENKMDQWSYHGYAITDFYQIDPRFGDTKSYLELASKAREKGIGLIRDVVLNHCGSGHWWMKDLPSSDWINFGGKYVNTNHRREVLRDIHASQADKELYTRGWFVETMPDLNQENPFMANYLIQNSIWWIEMAGLSGLRVDTYPYSDTKFLSRWSKRMMEEYPHLNITNEEWSTNPAITSYWQRNKSNPDRYVSYVPTPMDFPLQDALVKGLNEEIQWNGDFNRIYQSISNDFLYADPNNLLIFPDNHDMSRIFTQLRENKDHWKMAMVLMATLRGIPQMYYGTEVLMSNPNSDSHGEIRGEFPGGWPDHEVNAITGNQLSEGQKEAQNFIKTLFNFRKNTPALHDGKMMHFAPENGIYVYFRYSESQKIMVILNKNEKLVELDLNRFREILSPSMAIDRLTGKTVSLNKTLSVPSKSAWILEIQP